MILIAANALQESVSGCFYEISAFEIESASQIDRRAVQVGRRLESAPGMA